MVALSKRVALKERYGALDHQGHLVELGRVCLFSTAWKLSPRSLWNCSNSKLQMSHDHVFCRAHPFPCPRLFILFYTWLSLSSPSFCIVLCAFPSFVYACPFLSNYFFGCFHPFYDCIYPILFVSMMINSFSMCIDLCPCFFLPCRCYFILFCPCPSSFSIFSVLTYFGIPFNIVQYFLLCVCVCATCASLSANYLLRTRVEKNDGSWHQMT